LEAVIGKMNCWTTGLGTKLALICHKTLVFRAALDASVLILVYLNALAKAAG
jgi:hypothetical protein